MEQKNCPQNGPAVIPLESENKYWTKEDRYRKDEGYREEKSFPTSIGNKL